MVQEFTALSLAEPTVHDADGDVVDYECVTPCFWKRLWKAGERVSLHYSPADGDEIPRHFVPIRALVEVADVREEPPEDSGDPGEQAINKATSWNALILVGNQVVGLVVDTELTFKKAKADLLERYLAKKEEG